MYDLVLTVILIIIIIFAWSYIHKENFSDFPAFPNMGGYLFPRPIRNRKKQHDCSPIPPLQSSDSFNDDFFNFRDKVYHSSSMQLDPVDKFNIDREYGGLNSTGVKIQDLYDNLIKDETPSPIPAPNFPGPDPDDPEYVINLGTNELFDKKNE